MWWTSSGGAGACGAGKGLDERRGRSAYDPSSQPSISAGCAAERALQGSSSVLALASPGEDDEEPREHVAWLWWCVGPGIGGVIRREGCWPLTEGKGCYTDRRCIDNKQRGETGSCPPTKRGQDAILPHCFPQFKPAHRKRHRKHAENHKTRRNRKERRGMFCRRTSSCEPHEATPGKQLWRELRAELPIFSLTLHFIFNCFFLLFG